MCAGDKPDCTTRQVRLPAPGTVEIGMMLDAVVGIACDAQDVGGQPRYTANAIPVDTIARAIGALPLLVPPLGDRLDIQLLLDRIDGLFIPGGLTNVHPGRYREDPQADEEQYGPFDQARDATTLPMIRAALARGIPLLMTCRGFQELNVALGGSLKREPDDRPEAQKHGTPESAERDDERYKIRHGLNLTPGGKLQAILGGKGHVRVNSLHSQLVDRLAPALEVEATADDGAIEAVSVRGAKGFALGVVFHPEYWAERDATSRSILDAFANAIAQYRRAGENSARANDPPRVAVPAAES